VNFSIQQLTTENKLHSYRYRISNRKLSKFSSGGASTAQVCHIAKRLFLILSKLKLSADAVDNRVPTVFEKRFYENGRINLTIINKSRAFNLSFEGNKKTTELATTGISCSECRLSGAYEQNVVLDLEEYSILDFLL
jgi:hypothetical protein